MAFKMAKASFTPISFFLELPVYDMIDWWHLMQEANEEGQD